MFEENGKRLNLESFAGGVFSERVNQAIEEVTKNIADPNTPWATKRKVTVTLTFESNAERNITNVKIIAKPTLAPKESISTNILIDRTSSGKIIAQEYGKQIPGQQAIPETKNVVNNTEDGKKDSTEGLKIVK